MSGRNKQNKTKNEASGRDEKFFARAEKGGVAGDVSTLCENTVSDIILVICRIILLTSFALPEASNSAARECFFPVS